MIVAERSFTEGKKQKIFTFKKLESENSDLFSLKSHEILPVNRCSSCKNNLSFSELCQIKN